MAVTIDSPSMLQDAVNEVRKIFPGASVNEVMRMAALTAAYGERKAREIVFTPTDEIKLPESRVPLALTDREKTLIKAVSGGHNLSEMVRYGLAKLARQDENFIDRVKRGRPRGQAMAENAAA